MKKATRQQSFKNIDVSGKTIVFTGGTDGMGRAAVDKLAAMGARLMILGRNKSKTLEVVEELNHINQNIPEIMWIPVNDADCIMWLPLKKSSINPSEKRGENQAFGP